MRTVAKPFEGILGNTVELRILERLIASPRLEFNITDLSKMADVHRESASKVIEKLSEWNILMKTDFGGRFKLNEEEPMVMALMAFNDSIILHMFPEVSDVLEDMEEEAPRTNHEVNRTSFPRYPVRPKR